MYESGRLGNVRCNIFEILGVLSDGSYALCGIGESIPELVFGSARSDSLASVWRQSPMLVRLRAAIPGELKGVCARCIMRSRCLGHCIAQNYYAARDLTAPYYMCQEAFEQGLFPASRLQSEPAVGAVSG
jgi:radical SAM protein with 4Fe4S-binding SPASM domain